MSTAAPVPNHLSPEAKAFLAAPVAESPYPARDDTEGWVALADQTNSWIVQAFSGVQLPVEVEERDIAGVHTYVLRGPGVEDTGTSPVYLDIHGGALMFGAGQATQVMASLAAVTSTQIHWAVDYRMPPLHPYPAALDDVMAVYRALLEVRDPADIVVGGGSAGGNLAAALLLRAKDEGLPMPAALVLATPEVDLTESGDTFHTLDAVSPNLHSLKEINELYADGHDLAEPYLSPLFGDVTGFPPTFLTSGTRDLFLSNTVRMHRHLRDAGVEAELHVWDAMPHGGFGASAPEDREMDAEKQRFLAKHLRSSSTESKTR